MLKAIFIVSFTIFIIFSSLMYIFQRYFIYFPTKETPNQQFFHAEDMQKINLRTSDGLNLLAWYKAPKEKQPTLLYLHGNAGHIGNRMFLARHLITAGLGILLVEYRGYGGNKGKPTEQGFYTDARAAMRFLERRGISSRLVLYGESLGTGVAVKMATEFSTCALVLQSPYTSLFAVARFHYPWIFIPPSDRFDSLALIASLKVPILILHGKQDPIIPFKQGLELYSHANEPKIFIALNNKGHSNLWDKSFIKVVTDLEFSHF